MSGLAFLEYAIAISFVVLTLAMLLVIVRIVRGPTLPDRVLALDMLVSVGIGFIAVIAIKTGTCFISTSLFLSAWWAFWQQSRLRATFCSVGKYAPTNQNRKETDRWLIFWLILRVRCC